MRTRIKPRKLLLSERGGSYRYGLTGSDIWSTTPDIMPVWYASTQGIEGTNIISDINSKGDYGMYPCSHSKQVHSVGAPMWVDPYGGPLVMSSGLHYEYFPGTSYWVPGSQLLEKLETSGARNVMTEIRANQLFSTSRAPTDIVIEGKDPLDTDFSIWYLLVDLVQLVSLQRLLGLFKTNRALRRLKERSLRLQSAYDSQRLSRNKRNTKYGRHDGPTAYEIYEFEIGAKGSRHYSGPAIFTNKGRSARDAASLGLATYFGVIPTLRDLQDFLAILSRWRERYDHMMEITRTLHRQRLKPFDVEIPGVVNYPFTINLPFQSFLGNARVETVKGVHHRTVQFKWTAPEFVGWMSRVRQFIDLFGVVDPAAIWDVVPFSFVIDWFINIGGWLHNNRPRLFPLDTLVTDYCESIKLQQRVTWSLANVRIPCIPSPSVVNAGVNVENLTVMVSDYGVYVRRPFKPGKVSRAPSVLGANRSFVSPRRISVSAALAAQRIPR